MKKIIFYTLIMGLFLAINYCCTKIYCAGFDDIQEIQFLNFTATDVDSVAFETFMSGSNFTNRIDSTFTNARGRTTGNTELIIFMPEKINRNYGYKITLLSTGQVYNFSNFDISKAGCNYASDKYNVLNSYFLNGQKIHSGSLTISQ